MIRLLFRSLVKNDASTAIPNSALQFGVKSDFILKCVRFLPNVY